MHLSTAWDDAPLTNDERCRAASLVDLALAQGLNLFDHADIYARGKGERLFGDILRDRPSLRDSMVLQSKGGIRFACDSHTGAPARYDFSHAHLLAAFEGIPEASVQRPARPAAPAPARSAGRARRGGARAFDDLQRSGKVLYFGVSNHSASQMSLLQRHLDAPLVVNQIELSLLHHSTISETILANQTGGTHTVPPARWTTAASMKSWCRHVRRSPGAG